MIWDSQAISKESAKPLATEMPRRFAPASLLSAGSTLMGGYPAAQPPSKLFVNRGKLRYELPLPDRLAVSTLPGVGIGGSMPNLKRTCSHI